LYFNQSVCSLRLLIHIYHVQNSISSVKRRKTYSHRKIFVRHAVVDDADDYIKPATKYLSTKIPLLLSQFFETHLRFNFEKK